MRRTKIIALSVGLIIAGLICIYLLGLTDDKASKRSGAPDPTPSLKSDTPPVDRLERDEVGDSVQRAAATKAERERRRRVLQERFLRPSAAPDELVRSQDEPSLPPLPPESWTSLPEEYVGGIIRDQLIPAAESCYEDIAEAGASGALTLKVGVIGDEEIGGIVNSIEINQKQTSIQGDLIECVQLAAYEMEFEPPEAGQSLIEFEFSLEFSDEDTKD
jgi:hypothetical protein